MSNGLGGDTFTSSKRDGRTDGRRTDIGTRLIYPFFLKKKVGITILEPIQHIINVLKF